jgi:hypothetical protein
MESRTSAKQLSHSFSGGFSERPVACNRYEQAHVFVLVASRMLDNVSTLQVQMRKLCVSKLFTLSAMYTCAA